MKFHVLITLGVIFASHVHSRREIKVAGLGEVALGEPEIKISHQIRSIGKGELPAEIEQVELTISGPR